MDVAETRLRKFSIFLWLSLLFKPLRRTYGLAQEHQTTHTYLLTWPFFWYKKPPNWVWPSRSTKAKLMKTLWKADWFFLLFFFFLPLPPTITFHCLLLCGRQAAAELELITHLFNRLAEMWTELQTMPEKKAPYALFRGLGEGMENKYGIWSGWMGRNSGNCPFWPFWLTCFSTFMTSEYLTIYRIKGHNK